MTEFKLPISYCSNTNNLDSHLINDLEFDKSKLFKSIFKPKTLFGEKNLSLWGKQFTTDRKFLSETQKLLKKKIPNIDNLDTTEIDNVWKKITLGDDVDNEDLGFHEKYNYIEWEWFRNYNNNASF